MFKLLILLLYSQDTLSTPVRWPPYLQTRALTLEPTGAPSIQHTVVANPPNLQINQGITITHVGDYGIHKSPRKLLETLYYDNTPKCATQYREEVQEILEEECTENNPQDCNCSCPTSLCAYQNPYTTTACKPSETVNRRLKRCAIVYQEKCFDKYETEYKDECSKTYEDLCTTITVTKYVKNCQEEYPPECNGLYVPCNAVPHLVCSSVPVTKLVDKCTSVPKHSCKRITIRTPRQFCHKVPSKRCKSVPTPLQYPSQKCKESNSTGEQSCKELLECKSECKSCLSSSRTKSCHNVTKLVNVKVPEVVCES